MNKKLLILTAAMASQAPAAILYQVVPSGGALTSSQDPTVTTSSFTINDGNGFTGAERYWYGMGGGTALRAPFTESVSFGTTSPTTAFTLSTIQLDYLQFGGAGGNVNVEMIVNGNSLGIQSTPEANFFGTTGLIWDASSVSQASTFDVDFIVTEVGNGVVTFWEIEGNGARSGLTINGDVVTIPEASSSALIGLAGLGLLARRRRA